ncbi:MAG: GNAT family N-acetyltransferase [Bosea sp.]|uniref:GNAT family N-acetyltransferase n=1 Tax=Bosea sp. (in: a-proteobacteria) TaxID=1871050 RepID=UPI00239E56B7|nr:GNAT family N-acetyltransferase [Bosea sp. (in: a-proteobacteria)]MCP4739767.1 GNAT family N-acetyltransferase [Bosea sp. (in: a-proteobacteria)]
MTGRLTIRSWCESDIDPYAELVADPQVMRLIGNGKPRGRASAEREVRWFMDEIACRGWSRFAIEHKTEGFIGYIGFAQKPDGIDFGGRLARRCWGRHGIAFDSFMQTLELGFDELGFDRVYTTTDPRNRSALRINLKAGFEPVAETAMTEGNLIRCELSRARYRSGRGHEPMPLIVMDRRAPPRAMQALAS